MEKCAVWILYFDKTLLYFVGDSFILVLSKAKEAGRQKEAFAEIRVVE